MRQTPRRAPSSVRRHAVTLLLVFLATPGVWLHTGGDDDQIVGTLSHDRSGDRPEAGLTSAPTLTPGSEHCFLCHALRALHVPRPAVASTARPFVSSLRETPVGVLTGADARLLPPRSPPL